MSYQSKSNSDASDVGLGKSRSADAASLVDHHTSRASTRLAKSNASYLQAQAAHSDSASQDDSNDSICGDIEPDAAATAAAAAANPHLSPEEIRKLLMEHHLKRQRLDRKAALARASRQKKKSRMEELEDEVALLRAELAARTTALEAATAKAAAATAASASLPKATPGGMVAADALADDATSSELDLVLGTVACFSSLVNQLVPALHTLQPMLNKLQGCRGIGRRLSQIQQLQQHPMLQATHFAQVSTGTPSADQMVQDQQAQVQPSRQGLQVQVRSQMPSQQSQLQLTPGPSQHFPYQVQGVNPMSVVPSSVQPAHLVVPAQAPSPTSSTMSHPLSDGHSQFSSPNGTPSLPPSPTSECESVLSLPAQGTLDYDASQSFAVSIATSAGYSSKALNSAHHFDPYSVYPSYGLALLPGILPEPDGRKEGLSVYDALMQHPAQQ